MYKGIQQHNSEGKRLFVILSTIFLLTCFLAFIPAVRLFIITGCETYIIHRPLSHPTWNEWFLLWGAGGIISYVLLVFILSRKKIFLNEKNDKKLYRFLVPVITAFIVFLIMYKANWLFGDDQQRLRSTAINEYSYIFSDSLFTGSGRFWPLGQFHFNIPLFIYRVFGINTGLPVTVHFLLIALFYVISVVFLYLLFKEIESDKVKKGLLFSVFFICVFPITSRAFVRVFMDLIYAETLLIMLLSIFMYCYYKALKTEKNKYYISALLVMLYGTYTKEPFFGVFLIIALTNLLFRYQEQTKKERTFYALLILNGILFITLYYFVSFRNAPGFYNEGRLEMSTPQFIISIFLSTKIFIPVFLLGFIRLFQVLFRKDKKHLFYDGLLFAGMGYLVAFIFLRLNDSYYYIPAIILSLPVLLYWSKYLYEKGTFYALILLFSITMICVYNFWNESYQVKTIIAERENIMPYFNTLLEEHNNGKTFIWYEPDIDAFNKLERGFKKYTENVFLNYTNKTQIDYFVLSKNLENLNENVLFFYSIDNNQGRLKGHDQPLPEIAKILEDNHFVLYLDLFHILVYKFVNNPGGAE
jgi:hypothetical protein